MKFVQEGVRRSSSNTNVIKLDADRVGTSETLISEACIRGMYQYYRQVMGF
jgi:anthranilate 1,2-dioxygenase large subunit